MGLLQPVPLLPTVCFHSLTSLNHGALEQTKNITEKEDFNFCAKVVQQRDVRVILADRCMSF
jgi:hypothetical protein